MAKVKCNVMNCSYNNEKDCTADAIKIGGQAAGNTDSTCCGSFLNSAHYSNLAEYTSMRGDDVDILCNVQTCKYYATDRCSLDRIEVGGSSKAQIYSETECDSFELTSHH